MVRKKFNIVPKSLGDILSILSLAGFIGIFLQFAFGSDIVSNSMTPLFLILGGVGLTFVGRLYSIRKWARDGIQDREFAWVIALGIGLISVILGLLIWLGVNLGNQRVLVGWLALGPAVFIASQYFSGGCR